MQQRPRETGSTPSGPRWTCELVGSGTEWGRVGDGVRLPSDRNKWLIGVSEMWS